MQLYLHSLRNQRNLLDSMSIDRYEIFITSWRAGSCPVVQIEPATKEKVDASGEKLLPISSSRIINS